MIGDNYMVDFRLWSQTDGLKHGRTNLVVICLLHAKSGINQSINWGQSTLHFQCNEFKNKIGQPNFLKMLQTFVLEDISKE